MFGKWKDINSGSSEETINLMIDELMLYVNIYVAHPKPRGYGGAPVINDCTSSMLCGIEALGRCGRMDVVSIILEKLIDGREHLKGPDYSLWMSHIQRCVKSNCSENNFEKIFELNPKAFEVFFECERTTPNQIVRIAESLANSSDSVKKKYEQLAIKYKGTIYGLHETLYRTDKAGYIEENETPILNAIRNMQKEP